MASRVNRNRGSPPGSDRVDAALEASCEALFALQLIEAIAPDEGPLRAYAVRGTELLRRAIRELRIARGQHPSIFAFGFVVGGRAAGRSRPEAESGQPRP